MIRALVAPVVGQKVEARFGGKKRYYPGKVSAVSDDGKYSILYDDGETEKKVDLMMIRVVGEPPSSGATASCGAVVVGSNSSPAGKAEGQDSSRKTPSPDATPEHSPEDPQKSGRKSSKPASERTDPKDDDDDAPPPSSPLFAETQQVEARWGGKAKFYPATITKVHSDGTFDLLYTEDKAKEFKIQAAMIRATPAKKAAGAAKHGAESVDSTTTLEGPFHVRVQSYRGTFLKDVELFGKQDPFVKVTIGDASAHTRHRQDAGKKVDFEGEELVVPIPAFQDGAGPEMIVECFDHEKSQKHRLIGILLCPS
jgi:hypothetical protein